MASSRKTCRRSPRESGHSAARRAQLVGALGVLVEERVICEPLGEEHVHRAECEGGVAAGAQRQMDVRSLGGARTHGIDAHDRGAPLASTSRKNFQRCRWVDTMLAPQATTDRACTASSMSAAGHPPYVMPHAVAPAAKQIVPSIFAAPSVLKNRMSMEGPPCSTPAVPM